MQLLDGWGLGFEKVSANGTQVLIVSPGPNHIPESAADGSDDLFTSISTTQVLQVTGTLYALDSSRNRIPPTSTTWTVWMIGPDDTRGGIQMLQTNSVGPSPQVSYLFDPASVGHIQSGPRILVAANGTVVSQPFHITLRPGANVIDLQVE